MKAVLEVLVKGLVDEPDSVSINEVEQGGGVLLEVSVANNDLGKVIGKRGRIVNALRAVMEALGARENQRVQVEVIS